ncbi:MAG TPA: hypothetical protein VFV50_16345 [Bdellovibrionales bacterium]|nr:hypothetical protein [Bdellovibrionales bacterium]
MARRPNNRKPKSLLINPRFQLALISKVVIVGLLNVTFLVLAIEHSFQHFRAEGLKMNFPENSFYFSLLEKERLTLFMWIGLAALVNFAILFIGGLLVSHRIAGPLHRLKSHAREVAAGKTLKNVVFRKNDYFLEIADAFNVLLESHRSLKEKSKDKNDAA